MVWQWAVHGAGTAHGAKIRHDAKIQDAKILDIMD